MAGGGGSGNVYGPSYNGGTGYNGQAGGDGTKTTNPIGTFYGGGGGGAAGGGAGGTGAGGAAGGAGGNPFHVNGYAGQDGSSAHGGGGGGGGGYNGAVFAGYLIVSGTYRGGNGGAGGRGIATGSLSGGGGGGAGGYGAILSGGSYLNSSGGIYGGNGGAGGTSSDTNGGHGGDGGVGIFGKGSKAQLVNNASAKIIGGNGGTDNETGNYITSAHGGAGVVFNKGGTISNSGLIKGGNGYSSFGGAGITGANLSVTNAGTIAGGFKYANGTGPQAAAVAFTGGVNRFTITSTSSLGGTVDAFSTKDTFALGGDTNATFDLAQIGDPGSNAEYRGFGTLAKSGASTWTLSGAPSASSALAYRLEAGTLDLGGTTQTVTGLSMTSGTLAGGELDTSGSFKVASGTISALLGGSGALAKSTGGTLTLTDDNTYSGGTTIAAGTVSISTFDANGNYTGVGTGAVTLSGGTLELAASANLATEVDVAAGKVGRIGVVAGATDYLNYVVTSTGSSTISVGAGATLALGSAADTGTIVFQTVAGTVDPTASILIGGGTVEDPYGYLGQGFLSVAAKTTVAANATLDLDDSSDEIRNLQGTAASATIDIGTQSGTVLTIDAGRYAGTITGSGSLTKATSGRLVLSGANSYGGSTTVKAGILSLAHASNGGIDAAGANYITVQDGATLETAISGTLSNDVEFTSGTGTIGAAAGTTVDFTGPFGNDGASTIVFGSATDAGTIVFSSNGGGTVNGGAGTIEIGGGILRDGGSLGFILDPPPIITTNPITVQIDAGGTLDLNGNSDTISNLTGSGTLTNAAGVSTTIGGGTFGGVIAGAASVAFEGDTTLSGVSTNTGTTFVDGGVTLTLATGGATSAGSAIVDNGTIQLSGGTLAGKSLKESKAGGLVTGSGTVSANVSSALDFTSSGGALTFTGTDVFGGKLSGTKAIFGAGKDTFAAGSSISISTFDIAGAAVSLGANVTYRGSFDLASGSLNVGASNLNTYGALDLAGGTITGSGHVASYGTATLENRVATSGSATLIAGGLLTATGSLSLTGDSDLLVSRNGTYDLAGNGYIGARSAGDTITNQGLIEKTAGRGTSLVTAAITNTGTITAGKGTLDLTGAIGGTGALSIEGNSAMELGAIIAAGQKLTFGTGNGILKLDDAPDFHASISGFGQGDSISLKGFDQNAHLLYEAATKGTGGTLTVTDGSKQFSTHLNDAHNANGFSLTHTSIGETIKYTG